MLSRRTKSPAQLDREIAETLARKSPRRHHATRPIGADAWDVAMDALLEHDPGRAAQIVAEIRKERSIPSYAALTMDATRGFVNVLEEAPASVRDRFLKSLKTLQEKKPAKPKPGKPTFEEKAPGVMTLYVPTHGYFSAPAPTYLRYKRMPRAKLLERVIRIYEGTGENGEKASHWRGYDKDYLAMIVADAYGSDA